MAHTDDIAEKVASLLLDQTARAANFTIDAGTKVIQGAGRLTQKGYEDYLKKMEKDKEDRRIADIEGEISVLQMSQFAEHLGLSSFTQYVHLSDEKDYEQLLRENGIMYAKTSTKDNRDAKMFIFLNRDEQKVTEVAQILQARRGAVSELAPDLYFNDLAPENIRLVDGVDRVEMELFRKYARYERLLFTAIQRQDKYAVVYDVKDEERARKALLHVGWDLTGYNGARNREQIEYRLKGRSAAQISAEEGRRELFIVSKTHPGNYVQISAEDYTVYKQHKKVRSYSRGTPDFSKSCMDAVDAIDNAVVLDERQFHIGMTKEELEPFHTIELHERQYDVQVELAEQRRIMNLIMKSTLDDEHNATWGLSDPSVSYSEFSSHEWYMDTEEREAHAVSFEHFKEAAFYGQDRYVVQDVHLDEKNVDYIIAKAEEKRNSYDQGEPTRSRDGRTNSAYQDKDQSI